MWKGAIPYYGVIDRYRRHTKKHNKVTGWDRF